MLEGSTITTPSHLVQFTKHRMSHEALSKLSNQHLPHTQINKINTKGKKIKCPTKFNKQKH
jgi:hypothetical protein